VPRPPYWGGYLLEPCSIEFWQHGPHRLHDRRLYTLSGGGWSSRLLAP
jgi:pyridoxamine 5'-phosphate oxidase